MAQPMCSQKVRVVAPATMAAGGAAPITPIDLVPV